jgi:hypothetical protein
MRAVHQQGSIKRFHRTPWRFEKTFQTPLRTLQSFSAAIIESLGEVDRGVVTIDAMIMPAGKIDALLASNQIQQALRQDMCLIAETAHEVQSLLIAALSDWVDFLFVPSPRPFVLYADHDEYATFFANTRSNLGKVTSALSRSSALDAPPRVAYPMTRVHRESHLRQVPAGKASR